MRRVIISKLDAQLKKDNNKYGKIMQFNINCIISNTNVAKILKY